MLSYSLENRLLQCSPIYMYSTTSAEQRSSDRAPSVKAISRRATAVQLTLAAGEQRIIYMMAVITFKVQRTSPPAYLGATYKHATACGTYGHREFLCYFSLSPEMILANMVSVIQHLPSETHLNNTRKNIRMTLNSS